MGARAEELHPTEVPVEDPPKLSAEAITAGVALQHMFNGLPEDVRRELILPLANIFTSTEVHRAKLSSDDASELATTLEENAEGLREYAARRARVEAMPDIEPRYPADDY
jgi:hypothetical protein